MGTVTTTTRQTEDTLTEEFRDSAARYIDAIARRDPRANLGPDYVAYRASELWDTFIANYAAVQLAPYARHGRDAVRIALSQL